MICFKRVSVVFLLALTSAVSLQGKELTPVHQRSEGQFTACYLQCQASDSTHSIFLAFRDGKARSVAVVGVRHPFLSSDARLQKGKLQGTIQDTHPVYKSGQKVLFHVDVRVNDKGQLTGKFLGHFDRNTWNFKAGKFPGKKPKALHGTVRGRLLSAEQLQREQVIAAGADWPQWEGPQGNCIARDTGVQLIEDLQHARLVWKSEANTPAAPGPSKDIPRTMRNAPFLPYCSGGATPVIGDNKVFLRYTLPSGEAFDRKLYKVYVDAGYPAAALTRGRKLLSVAADDVVVCFDARTGAMLWRTTIPDAGINFQGHKIAQNNLSALYHDGRVFAVGSTLRFYALDANSGKLLWQQPLGPKHVQMEKAKAAAIKQGKFLGGSYGNRSWGFSPITAAGGIICNDKSGGLVAFDPATGKRRWHVEKCAADNATPEVWKEKGQERLLIANRTHLHCLDAQTGKELWKLETRVGRATFTVAGDLLAFRDELGDPRGKDKRGENAPDACVVYQLTNKGPQLLWTTLWEVRDAKGQTHKDQYSRYAPPLVHKGRLYLSGRLWTDCLDARTGKRLGRVQGQGGVANAGHLMLAHGRLFLNRDGKHGKTNLAMYGANPAHFRIMGKPEIWSPPHPNTTSYGPYLRFPIVDGRMFIRGNDAIYCYDLRKTDQ